LLHEAAIKRKPSLVECLVNHGADFRNGTNGMSYLHWAVEKGHLNVFGYLINHGADKNAKDNDGVTPMG